MEGNNGATVRRQIMNKSWQHGAMAPQSVRR